MNKIANGLSRYPNGSPVGVPTAFDQSSCRAFLIGTRQAFSHVTGRYTDFKNATTLIDTNVVCLQSLLPALGGRGVLLNGRDSTNQSDPRRPRYNPYTHYLPRLRLLGI